MMRKFRDKLSLSLSALAQSKHLFPIIFTTRQLTAVEASLRLYAVASGGFGLSRTKMVSLVEGGDVMIDWNEVKNPAHNVQVSRYQFKSPA